MDISEIALTTLVQFAARHVHECDPDEQIPVLQALGEALPDPKARLAARELATAQSKVAALQLNLKGLF
jgi:hypothetical protein